MLREPGRSRRVLGSSPFGTVVAAALFLIIMPIPPGLLVEVGLLVAGAEEGVVVVPEEADLEVSGESMVSFCDFDDGDGYDFDETLDLADIFFETLLSFELSFLTGGVSPLIAVSPLINLDFLDELDDLDFFFDGRDGASSLSLLGVEPLVVLV